MLRLRPLSASEQIAAHLRVELARGRWTGLMPGVNQLAPELGVARKTVEAALSQLEHEGLLLGQGTGRKRLIVENKQKNSRPPRVAILLYEPADNYLDYIVNLQHGLVVAGHDAIIAPQTLTELKMDVVRVARLVKRTAADAWVIAAGGRQVLKWFSEQPVPAFALFGRREGLPIAGVGPDKRAALAAATRHLISRGHRRIILLTRRERRVPEPGYIERAFLDELKAHGIPTGAYNLPDWEETIEGLQALLNSLFRVTPPTTIIVEEPQFLVAMLQALSQRGLRVPEQVSLLCTDNDPVFAWCQPAISHICWEPDPVVRRIVSWAATVSRGGKDVKQTTVDAKFIMGGTIGPVKGKVKGKG